MAAALQSRCAASPCPAAAEVGAGQLWCRVQTLRSRLRTTLETWACCFQPRVFKIPVVPPEGQAGSVPCPSCSPGAQVAQWAAG